MPPPAPRTTGANVLITEKRNLAGQGWSENYIMNVDDTVEPLNAALEMHKILLNERQKVSPVAVQLLEVRASELTVTGDSLPKAGGAMFTGPGRKVGNPADPDIGWAVRFQDASGQINDMQLWRGWIGTDADYKGSVLDGVVPNTVKTFLQMAINMMTNTVTKDGGGFGRYVIRSFARPGALGVVQMRVIGFALDANGHVKFTTVNPAAADVLTGDIMKIHTVRKRCVRGLSGEARVLNVDITVPDQWTFTLDRKFCCNAADLIGITGVALLKKVAFYDIKTGTINRLRKRKCGRPFGSIPGRRSGRCC